MMMMMMTVNDNESKKMRDPFRREIDFPLSFPFSVCRICKRFLILCIAKENFPKVRVFFQPFYIIVRFVGITISNNIMAELRVGP